MKVLMVITSHDQLGNKGRKTGFSLEGSLLPTSFSRMTGLRLRWHPERRSSSSRPQE